MSAPTRTSSARSSSPATWTSDPVVGYLLDTSTISEQRKGNRADPNVRRWFARHIDDDVWLSVLVIGEVRRGVERRRRRDPATAEVLDRWLVALTDDYADRILPVTTRIAERWGRLSVPDPLRSWTGCWRQPPSSTTWCS